MGLIWWCQFWHFWFWRVCKQAILSHLGHRKPARIHWKADAYKTSHSLVRILVQRHNWTISLRKWVRIAVTINGDRYRAMLNGFLFTKIEEENIGNIWFQQDGSTCHTPEATVDVLRPVFEDYIISRRADVVWPPRSCNLTSLDRSCRLLHGQPRQPFEWNYFILLTGRIVLSNRKRNLRKYSVVFLSSFQKKGTAEATLDVLRPVFEDGIISRRANVVWPPRSCDLTPLDYLCRVPISQRQLTL